MVTSVSGELFSKGAKKFQEKLRKSEEAFGKLADVLNET